MTTNLMEQYVKKTKTFIKEFTKMFFATKYDEEISKEFIDTYMESRIYSFVEEDQRYFYRRIYVSLLNKKKELQKEFPKMDEDFLEENVKIYQYVFYLDGVRPITDINELAKMICEKRTTKFNLDSIRGLENRIIKLYKNYLKVKEDFFKEYETVDFSLNIEKYILIDNTYKVSLDYNFKIPYIYSSEVINEVYNSGTVYEDKLIIEYILLALVCIKDIEKGNFTTKYIVELANSLFKKQGKLKQTLKVINNSAIQDKIFLKINYTDFEENKDLIYELIQDGFRFALIIDDTFNPTLLNLKKLSLFTYLLVPENSKNYDKIQENEAKLENTVIYDI